MMVCTADSYELLDNNTYAVLGFRNTNGEVQAVQCMVDAPVESLEQATEKMQEFFESLELN